MMIFFFINQGFLISQPMVITIINQDFLILQPMVIAIIINLGFFISQSMVITIINQGFLILVYGDYYYKSGCSHLFTESSPSARVQVFKRQTGDRPCVDRGPGRGRNLDAGHLGRPAQVSPDLGVRH